MSEDEDSRTLGTPRAFASHHEHGTPNILPPRETTLGMALLALIWVGMLLVGPNPVGLKVIESSPAAANSTLAFTALFFTHLEELLLPAGILAAVWLATRARKLDAVFLVVAMISERLLVQLQKVELYRARPDSDLWLAPADGLAFPSGHAASSMLTCTLIAFLLAPPRWRRIAVGTALALSVCIGASRMLLRVHWPTDVIAGWAFGLFWALGSLMLLGYVRQARQAPGRP